MMSIFCSDLSRRDLVFGASVWAGLLRSGFACGQTAPIAADGFRILRAGPGLAQLRGVDRDPTAILGYDGAVPGPTIRVRRGDEVRLRLVNDLSEATALHWHGVRPANVMDGSHPTQPPVAPGHSFDYRFACQDAGTFWYHASLVWPLQLDRGLSGLLLVDETDPIAVDQDIALLLGEWRLRPDGAIDDARDRAGQDVADGARSSNQITANGLPWLDITVTANERIRLRLVNATNSLIALRLDRHRAVVMALDGQPAEPFIARDSQVFLGPGNRADLFVDALLEPGASAPITIATEAGTTPIARLSYRAGGPVRAAPLPDPAPLPANPLPARMDFAGALKLDVPIDAPGTREAPWAASDPARDGPPGRSLFSLKRGRTVMLALANRTGAPVVIHVHGHAFRLLDRMDDGWKPFWLDTVVVPERQTLRIAFVADHPGKWLVDARPVGAGATPMAAWFEVT
jgi:FtsP/CotA-like multicopper oxidase with cupredoxin domain